MHWLIVTCLVALSNVFVEEQDEDLSLAIQMSLQTADVQRQMMQERAESRKQRAHSHTESLTSSTGGISEVAHVANTPASNSAGSNHKPAIG